MTEEPEFASAEHIKDPETGEILAVERDLEYATLIRAFNERECKHSETAPFRVRIANGAVQVRDCCTHCGERVGTALSQKNKSWLETLPWQSPELSNTYTNRRDAERSVILLDLAKRQYAERGRFTKSYTEYLASDAWKSKRALVMNRCGSKCEGCGAANATDIHHLTYRHLFNEFLFELIGLCRDCHNRITEEDRKARGIASDDTEDEQVARAVADCF